MLGSGAGEITQRARLQAEYVEVLGSILGTT